MLSVSLESQGTCRLEGEPRTRSGSQTAKVTQVVLKEIKWNRESAGIRCGSKEGEIGLVANPALRVLPKVYF